MKVLTVVGARPQFIKAAALSLMLKSEASVEEKIIHTGQHYDKNMSDDFFEQLSIPSPHYRLNLGGKSHGEMTGRMLIELEKIFIMEKPDWVIVYGDTNSTLAGALAASKLNIPVAHVEAGLRSFNRRMPEEVNRVLTDHLSELLFCPSELSADQLKLEGIAKDKISIVGDIMKEVLDLFKENLIPTTPIKNLVDKERDYFLATVHREENTDSKEKLESIMNGLNRLSKYKKVVLPIHPRTKKLANHYGIDMSKLLVVDPVSYGDMVYLLTHCDCLLTDSGGMQKEAYFLSKYCITLRDETEWVETVDAGVNVLVGSSADKIFEMGLAFAESKVQFPPNLYGDGSTSEKIIKTIKRRGANIVEKRV